MDAHDDLLEADPSKREGIIVREGQVHKDFFFHSTIIQNWFHLNESLKKKIDRDADPRDFIPFINNVVKKAVESCVQYTGVKVKFHNYETYTIEPKEHWPNYISYFPSAFTAIYCVQVDPEVKIQLEGGTGVRVEKGKLIIFPSLVAFKLQQSLLLNQYFVCISFDIDR